MNQYQKQNAARRIEGYYLPRPHETALNKHNEAFARAKEETLKHMRDAIAQTEALTFDEFTSIQKSSSNSHSSTLPLPHSTE